MRALRGRSLTSFLWICLLRPLLAGHRHATYRCNAVRDSWHILMTVLLSIERIEPIEVDQNGMSNVMQWVVVDHHLAGPGLVLTSLAAFPFSRISCMFPYSSIYKLVFSNFWSSEVAIICYTIMLYPALVTLCYPTLVAAVFCADHLSQIQGNSLDPWLRKCLQGEYQELEGQAQCLPCNEADSGISSVSQLSCALLVFHVSKVSHVSFFLSIMMYNVWSTLLSASRA